MKKVLQYGKRLFLDPQLDFRVRLFNVLACAGVMVGLVATVASIANNENIYSTLINLSTVVLALGLLVYSFRSGQYQRCYLLTIIVIFLVYFPVIFLTGGAYYGSMPSYFIMAVVFTVFMLEGRRVLLLSALEIAVYIAVCVYAYRHPERVNLFQPGLASVLDIIVGFSVVSIILGVTLYLHFRLYNAQQRELTRAREEALRLSETKSTFLANMSHEIRTPINVIIGMNEMVLRESDSPQVTRYGLNIQSAGETLLTLINNILDVSKIESGKMDLVKEDYQVADLVYELSVVAGERAEKHHLGFEMEIDETLPCGLNGDYIHIKQVAINFLSNAFKYTKAGSVTLRMGHAQGEGGEITLWISVEDTGIGIRQEHLETMFESFERIDLPVHRDIEGTGLGLAIAKDLVELMHGRIQVESVWGRGSVFTVSVPQRVCDAEPLGQWESRRETARMAQKGSGLVAPGGRVLVVDDNHENLQVVRTLLDRTLLHIDTVSSGPACIAAVKQHRYHVILMDYMMPGMDGIATLHRLKAELPGFDTPVIALTANVVGGAQAMFLQEGFAEYLSKPVKWQKLEDTLRRHLPREVLAHSATGGQAAQISPRHTRALAGLLLPYDVVLEEGLRYLSGDVAQYQKLAAYFTDNYARERQNAEALFAAGDWEQLVYAVHSLKSKALAMGAGELHQQAALLEKHGKQADTSIIEAAMPLLLAQWARVYSGLCSFASYWAKVAPPEQAPAPAQDTGALMGYIATYRRKEAEEGLDSLMAAAASAHEWQGYAAVKTAVQDLNFEKAERLLGAMQQSACATAAGGEPE